jgi:hypothetical protein
MRTQFVIGFCLACVATTAAAQLRPGNGVVGTVGGNGALTDVGSSAFGAPPLPSDPRANGPIDPRTGAPTAPGTPATTAPANAGLDQAPASASRPVIDGAVWGSAPNPSPAQNSGPEQ